MSQIPRTFTIGGDLEVNRIGYGAMRLADSGEVWGPPADREGAIAVLRRAVELGVNLVDTADTYSLGANEELVAEALRPYQDDVVIVTKAGVARPGPSFEEWIPLGRPEYLKQQAELSLRRLGLEQIDLFLLHRVDPTVPFEDQIGALKELKEAGKVRHVGLSQVDVEQLQAAGAITPIAAVQNLFNLTTRDYSPVVDYAESNGIAFQAFFPIAVGEHAEAGGVLAEVAKEIGATTAQTSLAWLLHRSPVIQAIPGTTSTVHLEENLAAAQIELSDEQLSRLADAAGSTDAG